MKTQSLSLLRYPGGKTRAVNLLMEYVPPDISTLVSPFFGGGSFEFAVASRNTQVYGYDIFTPLTDFWQIALLPNRRTELVNAVKSYYPLSKSKFYDLQQRQSTLPTKTERAAAFYVLNRASFSGSTLSGGMSPGHPRFTLSQIEKLTAFRAPNVSVKNQGFEQTLAEHPDEFMYLDPPYFIKACLYGNRGDTHRNFNHALLAKLLHRRKGPWLLSYNDCPEIRTLYAKFHSTSPVWVYGMSADKASKELLIMSADVFAYYQERLACQV